MSIDYKPRKFGFPYKLLKYLYENGKTEGIVLQEAIGMNKQADSRGVLFYTRASINFDQNARELQRRGLINILEDDWYELTPEGKQFIKTYKVR